MRRLLVTGGCGYVGSHMVKTLEEFGHHVVVLDNLSTGTRDSLLGGELIVGDCGNRQVLDDLFSRYAFDGVLHFASLIQVGESVTKPAEYYQTNVSKTVTLLEAVKDYGAGPVVFSSSAAVFGKPDYLPIDELHSRQPINPYGMSKLIVERILFDFDSAYGLRSVSLRYFNVAGADRQARIGEKHEPETHLIPRALQTVLKRQPSLQIFGRDFDTPDGTCIRDYIHVEDLVEAHLRALEYLWQGGKSDAFNLGNGSGYSVLEVIDSVERVTGFKVPIIEAPQRLGDPARLVADASRAYAALGWHPQYAELDVIVRDAWRWECRRRTTI